MSSESSSGRWKSRRDSSSTLTSLNVSTRTLLRRFADETGRSPLEYLQSSRIRRGRHLLETTDRTVASIAGAVGYKDSGTFTALFAKHTGRRPRDYRAAFRRGAN